MTSYAYTVLSQGKKILSGAVVAASIDEAAKKVTKHHKIISKRDSACAPSLVMNDKNVQVAVWLPSTWGD